MYPGGRGNLIRHFLESESEDGCSFGRGSAGREKNSGVVIDAATNPNKGVFEYEVRFDPIIHSRSVRMKLLNEHKEKFGGTKIFDGTTLYLPILLSGKITIFESIQAEARIEIKLIYKRKRPLNECIHFQRKQFDPSAPKIIPQHKLEIWPGYIAAVDEYEDGVTLSCDVSHQVLSTQTVLEYKYRNAVVGGEYRGGAGESRNPKRNHNRTRSRSPIRPDNENKLPFTLD